MVTKTEIRLAVKGHFTKGGVSRSANSFVVVESAVLASISITILMLKSLLIANMQTVSYHCKATPKH
jgi:hypothetical protein